MAKINAKIQTKRMKGEVKARRTSTNDVVKSLSNKRGKFRSSERFRGMKYQGKIKKYMANKAAGIIESTGKAIGNAGSQIVTPMVASRTATRMQENKYAAQNKKSDAELEKWKLQFSAASSPEEGGEGETQKGSTGKLFGSFKDILD